MAAAVLFIGALGGCNGLLNLGEGGGGRVCQSSVECEDGDLCIGGTCQFGNNGACWVYNAEGTCANGQRCVDGVCTRTPITDYCDCLPEQGCLNGQCIAVNEDTACSAQRPNGACLSGSVCVAGTCVEINPGNICSANRLNGLCPSGAACLRGQCVPIAEDPCGPSNTDGLCPSGARCTSSGTCELVPCSPSAPSGACTTPGTYCDDGTCKTLPCSQENPSGPCEQPGDFCSVAGECIPNGTCADDGDCSEGNYCGAAGICRPVGTCVDAADCGPFSTCNGGTCVRDTTCVDDNNCPAGEHCLNFPSGGQCQPEYKCYDSTDCASDQYCSTNNECVANAGCLTNADCTGTRCEFAQCRCSSVNTCVDINGCAVNADCGIGQRCNLGACVAIEGCDGNLQTDGTTCTGTNCCDDAFNRCSTNVCIPVGRCRNDADCGAPGSGVTCNLNDNTCSVGSTQCTVANQATTCGAGKYCTSYGICANGTDGTACTNTLDCGPTQVCNSAFRCTAGANCGGEEFDTTLVAPNMLILLDRSGSMNWNTTDNDFHSIGSNACMTQDVKRWPVAKVAIQNVLNEYNDGQIRFGLSTYPSEDLCGGPTPCPADCTNGCMNHCNVSNPPPGSSNDTNDWNAGNCEPGYLDEGVGGSTAAIMADLNANGPGGRTPTARALRVIANNPQSYGLPAANDTVERDNYILLITDGDPNCPTAGATCASECRTNNNGCNANCMVNRELARLVNLPKPIKVFTVGFAFNEIKPNLNCNAVYGQTSRCGGSVTTANCGNNNPSQACYYNASSPQALVDALADISRQISGCTFDMDQLPPDINQLYVFTRDYEGGVIPPGAPYDPVPRQGESATSYYTVNGLRVQLFGQVCEDVRNGLKKPTIIYGCPRPGG